MNGAVGRDGRLLTVGEYEALPDDDLYRDELVRGRLVREPWPASLHGHVQLRIARRIADHAERNELGLTLVDTGFILATEPATVRVPDVSFIGRERAAGYPSDRLGSTPPDLAIEIVSPSNRASELRDKVLDYFDAGVRLVWVVDPSARTVTVHGSHADTRILSGADELAGEDVLTGFRLSLGLLFDAAQ